MRGVFQYHIRTPTAAAIATFSLLIGGGGGGGVFFPRETISEYCSHKNVPNLK